MSIDDLAHDAEVEADVLRAVAHMTPARAQEFLIGLVLKIKRAASPASVGAVTMPKVLASTVVAIGGAVRRPSTTVRPYGTKTAEIIECVKRLGSATSTEICDALGLQGADRSSATATPCALKRRTILRKDADEKFSLATLETDLAAVGE